MRQQGRQSGRGPRRGGDRRGPRRFNDNRRKGSRQERSGRSRRDSRDFDRRTNRGSGRRGSDRDAGDRTGDKGKRISRDLNNRKRISRVSKRDDSKKPRDLDGELMNYWVKSGKGQDQDGKNLAQQKLNQEMDNYWKAKEAEKAQQKPQQ